MLDARPVIEPGYDPLVDFGLAEVRIAGGVNAIRERQCLHGKLRHRIGEVQRLVQPIEAMKRPVRRRVRVAVLERQQARHLAERLFEIHRTEVSNAHIVSVGIGRVMRLMLLRLTPAPVVSAYDAASEATAESYQPRREPRWPVHPGLCRRLGELCVMTPGRYLIIRPSAVALHVGAW